MRGLVQWKLGSLKPALAGLLACFVFLTTLASASEFLHLALHADAAHDQGHCVVCAIAKGQLDTPFLAATETFALLSVAWTIPTIKTVPSRAIDLSVAAGRGPPASISSPS